jgi:hypothetical protein
MTDNEGTRLRGTLLDFLQSRDRNDIQASKAALERSPC